MKTFKGKINGVEYTDIDAFNKALLDAQDGDNLEVSYETKACDCDKQVKDNFDYNDYLKKANKIFTDLFGPNFSSSFSKYLFGNSELKNAFEGKSKITVDKNPVDVIEKTPQKESDTYEITTRPAFDLMTLMKAFDNIDIYGLDKLNKECSEAVKKFDAICNTDTKACNWQKFANACEDTYDKLNTQWDEATDKISDLNDEIDTLNDQIDAINAKLDEKKKEVNKLQNNVNKLDVALCSLEDLDNIGKDYVQKVRTRDAKLD